MTAITDKIAREHGEFLDETAVSEGCRCGAIPGGEDWFAAHIAAVTEAAVRETIAAELTGRASALSPLVEREDALPVTIAVHTTLLEAASIARDTGT